MTADRERVLAELPLPLGGDAGDLAAIEIAVAVEDALGVVFPDALLDVATFGHRASIEAALDLLDPPG